MPKKKEKPGVMFYFDLEPAIEKMEDEDAGKMFKAILRYSHYGLQPYFDETPFLAGAWEVIKPRIDADTKKYADVCEKKRVAGLLSHLSPQEREAYAANAARAAYATNSTQLNSPQLNATTEDILYKEVYSSNIGNRKSLEEEHPEYYDDDFEDEVPF